MGSFAEGLFTFETKEVSKLATQGRINEELDKIKSYERMYTIKYGPFTLGNIKWEILLVPIGENLCHFLCLLDDAVVVKKFGYIYLVQDHSSNGDWKIHTGIELHEEEGLEIKPFVAEALDLKSMALLTYFSKSDQEKYSKDDCFLNKFVFWVDIADDSRKVLANAVRLGEPHQPEFISPNLSVPSTASSTLLVTGDFADIIFLVKEDTFAAHRCVLAARSSVFRTELLALPKDINTSMNSLRVSVRHIDGLTFKHLLHFIYTDTLPPDFKEVTPPERYHRMFVAAHCFKIEGLKLICEKQLTKVVADAMITAIDLLEYHECSLLEIVQHD
ncbi:BTB/POZ and MATH domain-containing protein 1-like [Carex rostrata]